MATARAKHGTYLFRRSPKGPWWYKLRSGGKRVEKSTKKTDYDEAYLGALQHIGEHKARLIAARPRIEPTWQHEYAPGREHVGPDGGRILAQRHSPSRY